MKRITKHDIFLAAEQISLITGQTEIFIVGMASTLLTAPEIHTYMTDDVDLFTPESESAALDQVIEMLGEGSPFEQEHGFYVERFGTWVMLTQPDGWKVRAHITKHPNPNQPNTLITIRALSLIDLVYNKLEANRPKDLKAIEQLLKNKVITPVQIESFIKSANLADQTEEDLLKTLHKITNKLQPKIIQSIDKPLPGQEI